MHFQTLSPKFRALNPTGSGRS